MVNVTSATNADVDPGGSATIISQALQAELLVAFSPAINRVCKRPAANVVTEPYLNPDPDL